jgi:hypothetical protein
MGARTVTLMEDVERESYEIYLFFFTEKVLGYSLHRRSIKISVGYHLLSAPVE